MGIKFKLDGTIMSIDMHDLIIKCFFSLSKYDQMSLIDDFSCNSQVIEFVTQQIISRWTDEGSRGDSVIVAESTPTTAIDKAWRDVAKASGEVAKREIERLEEALRIKEERIHELELRQYTR